MTEGNDLVWSSSSRSDVGMVRSVNEDACLDRPEVGLWAVADGMGGHSAGDVASSMIVQELARIEQPGSLSDFVDAVETVLLDVNARLREIARSHENQTIGSTVVSLMMIGRHCICMWAGDSRIYRLRDGKLEKLTQDHALVEELVEKGVLSRDEAARHPQGNLVTRAVGATDALQLDLEIYELNRGDIFMLCSDGLDKEVKDDDIARVLREEPQQRLSETLVELALSRGARDNVTVVTVRVDEAPDVDGTQPSARRAEGTRADGS